MSQSGQCIGCKHYLMMGECEAFPDKIPYKIISGQFIHTSPYPGDHGIQYEPLELNGGQERSIMAPSALDRLHYLDFSNLHKSESPDYGSIHVPRLVGDSMEDEDKLKEDKDEELEKEGSDLDLVRERLADESGGVDALSQALEGVQDPQLKEILQAISEDEAKHQAALQQWLQEHGEDEGEDKSEDDADTGADDKAPTEGEGEAVAASEDAEGPAEMGDIPEEGDAGQGEPAGAGDKADLIDDIRAVLAEHSEEEELGKEDKPEDGKEEDKDEDLPFLKDAEGEEDEEDETEKRCSKSYKVPIIVSKGDQQIVYGVVSEPDSIDLQGDRLSKAEIVKACHKFMQTRQKIGKEHEGPAKANIIESYIAPVDFKCNGQDVRKGSWVMAVKIHDPELWQAVKKGDITGFSIAGTGTRTPF